MCGRAKRGNAWQRPENGRVPDRISRQRSRQAHPLSRSRSNGRMRYKEAAPARPQRVDRIAPQIEHTCAEKSVNEHEELTRGTRTSSMGRQAHRPVLWSDHNSAHTGTGRSSHPRESGQYCPLSRARFRSVMLATGAPSRGTHRNKTPVSPTLTRWPYTGNRQGQTLTSTLPPEGIA